MINSYIAQYSKIGILVDTNLLILFLIGIYDTAFISKFKRTIMYTQEDFKSIKDFIKKFENVYVTPQILAEIWNLVEKIENLKFKKFLEKAIPELFIIYENYIPKNIILAEDDLSYIGITDMSIILSAKQLNCLVLTDDFKAYSNFCKHRVTSLNINHFRPVA